MGLKIKTAETLQAVSIGISEIDLGNNMPVQLLPKKWLNPAKRGIYELSRPTRSDKKPP